MQEQLLNSNNLKEKLKYLGVLKKASPNVQEWLNTIAHKHWLKILPQETFTGTINEGWFQQKSQNTIFKHLVITPQFTSEINHLIDFLNQNYQIKKEDEITYKSLNKLNYLECQRQSQKWIDRINNKTSLEEDWDGLKEIIKIDFEGHEYTLYELTSKQNLLREGKVMNNCISTYANQSEEENKNKKFYSLRNKDNKSLVSMSGRTDGYFITDLERVEWINNMAESSGKAVTSFVGLEEKLEHDLQISQLSYESYMNEMGKKRGNIYTIEEIKEKNNEILEIHRSLVKKLMNELFKKNEKIVDVFPHVLNEINFTKLEHANELFTPIDLRVSPHYEVGMFNELKAENYKNISYLPESEMKTLKTIILENPNSIPLELMKKTSWINIKDTTQENIFIKNNIQFFKAENSKIKLMQFGEQNLKQFTLLNNCKYLDIEVSSVNNLIIKNSKDIKMDVKDVSFTHPEENSYVTLIDCSVKKAKFYNAKPYGVNPHITGERNHFLLIDLQDADIKKESPFSDKFNNVFYVDTIKNKITQENKLLDKIDIYPYIKAVYYKEGIGLPSKNLENYIKTKINFLNINIVPDLESLEVNAHDLYNLKINIPCKDKSLLLKAIENPNEFKDIVYNMILKTDQDLYEKDFEKYQNIEIPKSFYDLVEIEGKKEILCINEEFKKNPNEINYAKVVGLHLEELKETDSNLLTPCEIEKIKLMKEVYLENMDTSRVNNSRTKLTKVFAKNLADKIEDALFYPQRLTDEAKDFLQNILLTPKEPISTNRIKI